MFTIVLSIVLIEIILLFFKAFLMDNAAKVSILTTSTVNVITIVIFHPIFSHNLIANKALFRLIFDILTALFAEVLMTP